MGPLINLSPPAPPNGFHARLDTRHGFSVIYLAGEVCLEQSGAFERTLLGMLDRLEDSVVLELSGLRFINVIGMGVIVCLGTAVHARGGRMMLLGASPRICGLIRQTRLHELFGPAALPGLSARRPQLNELATCA